MNSDKKVYYEMLVRNEEKISSGHFSVYKPVNEVGYKVNEVVYITNPITRKNEKCKIIRIHESENVNTEEKGTMVHFEGV